MTTEQSQQVSEQPVEEVVKEEKTEQTLQEKAEVTEQEATPKPEPVSEAPTLEAEQAETPEPISELPGEEVSPEAQEVETKTVQEELADLVRGCVIEGKSCRDLSTRFTEASKELGISFDKLLDAVFELVTPKEA